MNDPIVQKAFTTLSTVIIALGAGLGILGVYNLMEGYRNNDPAARLLGERQLRAGGGLVFLAAYIKEGKVPAPEIMEYLTAQ